jgi:hypothetical protein
VDGRRALPGAYPHAIHDYASWRDCRKCHVANHPVVDPAAPAVKQYKYSQSPPADKANVESERQRHLAAVRAALKFLEQQAAAEEDKAADPNAERRQKELDLMMLIDKQQSELEVLRVAIEELRARQAAAAAEGGGSAPSGSAPGVGAPASPKQVPPATPAPGTPPGAPQGGGSKPPSPMSGDGAPRGSYLIKVPHDGGEVKAGETLLQFDNLRLFFDAIKPPPPEPKR